MNFNLWWLSKIYVFDLLNVSKWVFSPASIKTLAQTLKKSTLIRSKFSQNIIITNLCTNATFTLLQSKHLLSLFTESKNLRLFVFCPFSIFGATQPMTRYLKCFGAITLNIPILLLLYRSYCTIQIEMFYLNTIEQLFLFVEQLFQLEVCLP